MRTINEIKDEMTGAFMQYPEVRQRYGFGEGEDFDRFFSKAGIESVFFYIVAACVWALEKLFDLHRQEVAGLIREMKPHTLRWYVSKAKAYLHGVGIQLVDGADYYDTSLLSESDIAAAQVVKYAAAMEKSGVVYLKVAAENNGAMAPLGTEEEIGLTAYLKEVKDAGVIVNIINKPADYFYLQMKIFYDPMVLNGNGLSIRTGTTPVQDTVRAFIKDLPFNGEYRNVALVDALQQIEGVVIPELIVARTRSDDEAPWTDIDAKANPESGYYAVYDENDLDLTFIAYETISN